MNARQQDYRLSVELRQVEDAVSCLFHTLILHRSLAKFHYRSDSNYTLGALGFQDVNCEHIDLSYVRISSEELNLRLAEEVTAFRDELHTSLNISRRTPVGSPSGAPVPLLSTQVGLEFYQKKKRQWPMGDEEQTWEKWTVGLDICRVSSMDDFSRMRESVAESLGNVMLHICTQMNRAQYLPKMPTRTSLNDIFDTQLSDCQPYLFKITRQTAQRPQPAVHSGMSIVRRLIKDTLF